MASNEANGNMRLTLITVVEDAFTAVSKARTVNVLPLKYAFCASTRISLIAFIRDMMVSGPSAGSTRTIGVCASLEGPVFRNNFRRPFIFLRTPPGLGFFVIVLEVRKSSLMKHNVRTWCARPGLLKYKSVIDQDICKTVKI